jgi:hypothetical protein
MAIDFVYKSISYEITVAAPPPAHQLATLTRGGTTVATWEATDTSVTALLPQGIERIPVTSTARPSNS